MKCETHVADHARMRVRWLEQVGPSNPNVPTPTVQGIDYVEVLDFESPSPELARRILLVHTFQPATGLGRANVLISGALEAAVPTVRWAYTSTELAEMLVTLPPADYPAVVVDTGGAARPLSAGELSALGSRPDGDRVLVVHIEPVIDPRDDAATYTLTLNTGGGLDPRLNAVEFSLTEEAAVDFDCAQASEQVRSRMPAPPLDYQAKDYATLRRLMLDRMAVVMPRWDERNPADIGVALVELLAYAGDQLSYYQDAVATESYLGTARRRISVRRHARLLDYRLHEGNNARVWVCIAVNDSGSGVELPAGLVLVTRLTNQRQPAVPSELTPDALLAGALFFETMHPITPRRARNRIAIYDWGGALDCLPRGATRANLVGSQAELAIAPGDVLVFEAIDDAITGRVADPTHRHAVRVRAVREVEDRLDQRVTVEVTWHEADALPFSLALEHPSGGTAAIACGNVVLADHGRTIRGEPLIPDTPDAVEPYRPRLAGLDVTHREPLDIATLGSATAGAMLVQRPERAIPAIALAQTHDDAGASITPWTVRRDLLASGSFDRHAVLEVESDRVGWLRFGDDVTGRRANRGGRWTATYRVGNGADGNVGAEAIAHAMADPDAGVGMALLAGIDAVRNPLPAVGGADPERLEQARLRAPTAFRKGERAVTAADYAELTERHPEVQKALAYFRWTGSWNTVFITVDRQGGMPLDLEFETELRAHLEPFRMAGQDLEFVPPLFVPLDIAITIHVRDESIASVVKADVARALGSGEDASGRRGLFHPDNFTFGDAVYLSQLVAAAMKVPGVAWIDTDDTPPKRNRFQRYGLPPRGELARGVLEVEPLEIIRVDDDPAAPHNGRIELMTEGGL